ncbi:hypothetical protein C8J56DRAFT_1047095 [Mycena floridula]|nr:hypothetical protein C8J56DRAFT_1047095 [Mycena floridula]
MKCSGVLLLFTLLGPVSGQVTLLHRFYHPLVPEIPFSERGTVDFSANSLQPLPTFSQDLHAFGEGLKIDNADGALYQVALKREGAAGLQGEWDLSSVKACHLQTATEETFVFHTSGSDETPYALDYFVSRIPHDGKCPPVPKKGAAVQTISSFEAFAINSGLGKLNTTIYVRSVQLPPLPELKAPPPVTPQGQPVQAVPEKTFIQKYWMYLAAAVIALMMAGGGEEPRRE